MKIVLTVWQSDSKFTKSKLKCIYSKYLIPRSLKTLTDSLSQWKRILMWQLMIQQRIRLPLTVICHHTPPAVHRVYMRHRHDSSSCLSNGQKICLFLLTCHFETRWDWLTFASVLKHVAHTWIMVKMDDMYFFGVLRWFCSRRHGVRCSSCVPSSGLCPWTAVLFCLFQIFPPHINQRSASLQLTCGSWKTFFIASKSWLLTLLSLPAWRPLYCSSQVRSYLSSNKYLLLNGQSN